MKRVCVRLVARRKSRTASVPSFPSLLSSTTTLRWCRSWGLKCTILTLKTAVCKRLTSWDSWSVPWDRFAIFDFHYKPFVYIYTERAISGGKWYWRCLVMTKMCLSVQIVSSRKLTKPLVKKDKMPAGKGTITVSFFEWGTQWFGEIWVHLFHIFNAKLLLVL